MNALLHALAPLERDNPARVAPILRDEVRAKRFAEYSPAEQRRLVDHWLSTKDDSMGYVLDKVTEIDVNRLLMNFLAGDDAENGRLISQALLSYGDAIDNDQRYWERER